MSDTHAQKTIGGAWLCEVVKSFPVGKIAAQRYRTRDVTCIACIHTYEAILEGAR